MNRKKTKDRSHNIKQKSGPSLKVKTEHHQNTESQNDSDYNWVIYAIVLLLALVTLGVITLVVTPRTKLKFPPAHPDKKTPSYNAATNMEKEDDSSEDFVHSGVSCDQLMNDARKILDTRPQAEWESALDLLATCALQEPKNPSPRWNLAIALMQMDRDKEAIGFIDEALILDPTNLEFLKTGGAYLAKRGYHTESIKCLENYLEVALHVPRWEELLASISILREDEWEFLYDAGEDIVTVLEMLQGSYLKATSLIKAGYLYKVLIGLKGEKVELELLGAYSAFAFGLGDVSTGIKYLRKYTEKQYIVQGYGDIEQAYEVVTAHSLRLLTAGFDSTVNSIVKNLLNGGNPIWEELVYNCDMQESNMMNFSVRVRQSDVRKMLIKCIIVQGVINQLVGDGAVLYAENIFGWTPLLHVAALGSSEIIKQILNIDPDPHSRTVLAQTALHVAAIRGSYSIVEPMLRAGLRVSDRDYFNRTALNVACLHRWSAKGMARALGQKLPPNCPAKPIYSLPPKLHSQGGWLGNGISLPKELTKEKCDIDVLAIADVQTFVYDYLSIQRPVLIRNVTNNQVMKTLYQKWQRNRFEQEYGTLKFTEAEIPHAEAKTSQQTPIKKFMASMKKLNQDQKDIKAFSDFNKPTYIFETITSSSPILADFKIPPVLDPELTNIEETKIQLYLGPTLSGSPMQFHKNSWNILIYGQRRWFLYPPDKAFYSKWHVLDWWKENRGNRERGWSEAPPLECVQYPGDMLFVPDMWGQAVINLKESIGLASEFVHGPSEFSI